MLYVCIYYSYTCFECTDASHHGKRWVSGQNVVAAALIWTIWTKKIKEAFTDAHVSEPVCLH